MRNSRLCSIVTIISLFTLSLTLSARGGPPALRADLRTNQVTVSWVSFADAYLLETTDRLDSNARWWPARLAAVRLGDTHSVTLSAVARNRFFRLATNDLVAWFQTAQGPLAATGLGVVLPHEHLLTDLRGPTTPGYGQADADDVVRVMKPLLQEAVSQGVGLLVECSSIGVGRNASLLRRLAAESGLPVVVPTGVYGRANYAPAEHRNMSEDDLTALFIKEITEGIEDTGIKAGFIKIATSDSGMTTLEEKFLRAAGRAALATDAAVASHTATGSTAKKQADILETISPAIRFIWVHAQAERTRKWHRDLAARGGFIELDSLGWNPGEDGTFITAIKELVAAGQADRILVSHDAGWYQPGQRNGGTQMPYSYLTKTFIPKLRNAGLDSAVIRMITEENPLRAFAFLTRHPDAPLPTRPLGPATSRSGASSIPATWLPMNAACPPASIPSRAAAGEARFPAGLLRGAQDRTHDALTPSLSHPMGEGARRAGEGHGVFHPIDSSVIGDVIR